MWAKVNPSAVSFAWYARLMQVGTRLATEQVVCNSTGVSERGQVLASEVTFGFNAEMEVRFEVPLRPWVKRLG